MNNITTPQGKILIIDDTPSNVKLLLNFLTNSGFQVLVTKDAKRSIQKAEYVQPDLILLDVLMPDMDGFEVCQQLKSQENTQDIPVIFMTALDDTTHKIKGFDLGGADYISKPFHPKEVLVRINAQLTLRKQQQQLLKQNQQLQQEITVRKQAEDLLRIQRDLAIALSSTDNLTEALDRLLETVLKIDEIDSGSVYLVDISTGELEMVTHQGFSPNFVTAVSYYHKNSPQATMIMSGKLIYIHYDEIPATSAKIWKNEGLRSVVSMPVRHNGQIIAAINLASHTHDKFSLNTRHTIEAIASQVNDVIVRIRTVEQLRQTTEQLSLLLEQLPIVPYTCEIQDDSLVVTYVNSTVEAVTGYTTKDFTDNPTFWANHIHPDERESIFKILPKLLEKGNHEYEYRWQTADGSYKWFLDTVHLVKNSDGYFSYLVGTWHDITNRKQVEKSLQANETLLAEAQSIAHLGNCERNLITNELRLSEETFRIFGLSQETYPTIEMLEQVIHPDDRKSVKKAILQAILYNKPYKPEYRIVRNNGTIRYIQAIGKVIQDAKGKLLYLRGTVQDITERKQVELDLQQSKTALEQANVKLNHFKITLDMTLDCVFMLDIDTYQFFYANQGAAKLLGYSQEKLLQMTPPDIDAFFTTNSHSSLLESLLNNSVPALTFESIYQHKNSSLIPVEIFAQCIRLSGHATHFVLIVRNVTERKKNEAQLQQAKEAAEKANRAKSTFLANMSHELRTPLNAILGYTQIFKRDKTLSASQQEGIDIIHRNGEYLLTLISDILDLSKVEAGKLELYPTDFNFNDFFKGIVDLFRMRAEQKKISFNYQQLSDLPHIVHADEKRLRQILINFLSNAIKFTQKGGVTLKVSSIQNPKSKNRQICFQIEDTGIGIAPDALSQIFLPFEQVGDSSAKAAGTGLGLSITKKLIEMMGGKMHVESVLKQGSTFEIALNLTEVSDKVLAVRKEKPIIIGFEKPSRKILVVDDVWENCLVLINLLKPLGFEMKKASDGFESVKKARQWQPDLILMDLVMQKMDGFEATRQIRKIPAIQNVVIIAVSASTFDFHQQKCFESGCDDFIAKPIRAEMLLAYLQKYLNLKWIYRKKNTEKKEIIPQNNLPLKGLNTEQATKLYNITLRGDIDGIVTYIQQLAQKDKQLAPFAKEIYQLADDLAIRKIRKIAKRYMEES
ncbi:response regulator [Candidatus Parabeggiatoa sp. HSG14]|uniref:response regulator n=1 Tax=Candidatus Parabeggiatoa sp. HSG14 TaxID=3055593 RepID=UPI0025A77064|nr:response regulator [Thiotrichales bacterium HSG14]